MRVFLYVVSMVAVAAITGHAQIQITEIPPSDIVLRSHNVAEMTISADKKLMTIHRALDVNTVLCIERQPTSYTFYTSNTLTLGSPVKEEPKAEPKTEIVPRVCMTVEKWLAVGDKE